MKINTEVYEIRVWSWFDNSSDFPSVWSEDYTWIKDKFNAYCNPAEVIDLYLGEKDEVGYTIEWNGDSPSANEIKEACHKVTIEYLKHKGVSDARRDDGNSKS